MMSNNDSDIRRAVLVEGYKAYLVDLFTQKLKEIDRFLQKSVFKTDLPELNQRSLNKLLKNTNDELNELLGLYVDTLKNEFKSFFDDSYKFEQKALLQRYKSLKGKLSAPKSLEILYDDVLNKPLELKGVFGLSLDEMLKSFKETQADRITRAIRLAHHKGLTNRELIKFIRGSKAKNYQDGILNTTQRNAATIARTGTAIISNEATYQFINSNKDLIKKIKVVATLDGRTSTICRSLDGRIMPVKSAVYPPYHFNCRSKVVPVIGDDHDTKPLKRASKDGVVRNMTYYEWLKTQSDGFQDQVLGKKRAKLFREGGLSAYQFADLQLDKNFKPLTLKQMQQLEPLLFEQVFEN